MSKKSLDKKNIEVAIASPPHPQFTPTPSDKQ
jgi:hypothetical protein